MEGGAPVRVFICAILRSDHGFAGPSTGRFMSSYVELKKMTLSDGRVMSDVELTEGSWGGRMGGVSD